MQWKELASVLNSLRFSQMKSLSQLFLVKPLWIFPTAKATATCMQMCERLFPKSTTAMVRKMLLDILCGMRC